jgi:hypothetical protein
MGENSHRSNAPLNDNQDSATSDDPADGRGLSGNPKPHGSTPVGKAPEHDQQNQATVEELGREGLGVAPKE